MRLTKAAMLAIAPLILLTRTMSYAQAAEPTAALSLSAAESPVESASQNLIEAQMLNLRNSNGLVRCAIWNSPNGYPRVDADKFAGVANPISNNNSTCVFKDLPPGTYAMAILHDENENGHMDYDFLGLPKKGYGFSNNVKGLLGPPSFQAASFRYDGGKLTLPIRLNY